MSEPLKLRSQIKQIYMQPKDLASAEERNSYVETACGADTALRRRIETLLEADQAAEGFLSNNAMGDELELGAEKPGAVIGHYRLLERIGEGGFGVVYRAEQLEPVRRRVALKIIKLGMDTKEVVARFEAERQALTCGIIWLAVNGGMLVNAVTHFPLMAAAYTA